MIISKRNRKLLFPILLLVGATLFKINFDEVLGSRTPFLLYTAVVIATTWYSGWAIGLITNFVCLVIIDYFFVEPIYSFAFPLRVVIQMVIYTLQNLLLAAMGYSMKTALTRSESAENKFRLLVEQACEALVLRSEDGTISYVSPKITQLFGYDTEEFKNTPLQQLFTQISFEDYLRSIREILAIPGSNKKVKLEYIRQDGTHGWLEADLFNYFDEPGINSVVTTFRDITERLNMERQKDGFIGIASHELKTPLTSLKAYLQLLEIKSKTNEDPFFAEVLLKATRQVNKMAAMINGFLNLSRFESGKLHLQITHFDLNASISEIIDEFKLSQTNRNFIFTPDVPIIIRADKDKIESVVTNLISNATKYSPSSKPIQITVYIIDNQIHVDVKDQGIGIRESDQGRIMERYYRIESEETKSISGFGIGLYLSAQILELHGGKLGVKSEYGKGSTFYFTLPLKG